MSTIRNISLYIKRAESYHTKEYISNFFERNNYGKVHDVRFIKKVSDIGIEYNGAIVTFERWFVNATVKKLFDILNSSADGIIKLIHDPQSYRYWFVHEYKAEFQVSTKVDETLPDKERIQELEKLVNSMAAQMHFMQAQQEKNERLLMEYEQKETQSWLYNMELKSQLLEKEKEKEAVDDNLRSEVINLTERLIQKETECEQLKEELYEEKSILAYVETQALEMREMIKKSETPYYAYCEETFDYKGKMTIEELID